ncbi:hypothetical protein FAZ79_00515 [Guyparkeria sp. SB14A]|uniref:hypothetical protein n=1 Tax=Guyparkeria sp. SB14A TaxID=2571147 RepID=UPI0010AC3BFE|nr:hypothetical protein [Guyparkeria sp. SB14A]TKA91822.1 hypothetical protein FAZ79_00515 [Guyparkeria sp. SB14A]
MSEVLFTSTLFTLVMALAAVIGAVFTLRWLDRRAGHSFREAIEVLRHDPLGLALYHGLRFLGVCLLVGLLFS